MKCMEDFHWQLEACPKFNHAELKHVSLQYKR